MDIEEKKKIFLKKFERAEKESLKFNKYIGPGLRKKIQRLIFSPQKYLPYIFWRFGLIRKEKKSKLFYGKEIYVDSSDSDGFMLNLWGILIGDGEETLTKFFIKNLQKKDIFYDIGANYGFYSCLAAELCKEVHSFEPHPIAFRYLSKNLKGSAFLNQVAVAEKEGKLQFFLSKTTGSSTIKEASLSAHTVECKEKITVNTISLDKYLYRNSEPTVIKMDVEGAEELVIEGVRSFLKRKNPLIAMEVWPKNKGGEISMKAVNKLRELGFGSYFINRKGELKYVEGDLSKLVSNYALNFIFKKIIEKK